MKAALTFEVKGQEIQVELAHAPTGEDKGAPESLAYVGGSMPLPSGQCLRHNF